MDQFTKDIPAPNVLLDDATSMLTRVNPVFTGMLGALGNLLVVLVLSLYLTAQPQVYIGASSDYYRSGNATLRY